MPDQPDPNLTGAYQPASPARPPEERFAPGILLAGRYRIVAPLGKGGMGEVYRADDLTLGQPVALKFLPPHLAADPERIARFRKEVASARKVSHPNVCRVYDVAEFEGQSFLTMEFVDGEDLSSVFKRLGRVPEEKGIEIARQLCSALAAVHDPGLLHRDLKPANVMLDGRGKVRLTDFGLTAAAEDLSATEVRSGTPLYQAPEQLSGKEVTVRSDLFALGLVLYELFTGKRAFVGSERDTPPSKPSSHVSGLNPAVERVILRCLKADPASRPRSATEVLASLPGGDPLAAAIAAGETPSPQLVADAGEVGLIKPRVGVALFLFVALGLVAVAFLNDRTTLFPTTRVAESPADQERTSKQLLARLGLTGKPTDWASGYLHRPEVLSRVAGLTTEPNPFGHLADGRTHSTSYFYRRSPELYHDGGAGYVLADLPPLHTPGEAVVELDVRGRLLGVQIVPPRELPEPAPRLSEWWEPLLDAVRPEPGDEVRPADLKWTPPVHADDHKAWVIRTPAGLTFRAEAAALRGRAVWFHLTDERERPGASEVQPAYWWWVVVTTLLFAVVFGLALRNVRRGRGDHRGGCVAGVFIAGATFLTWVLGGHHTVALAQNLDFLMPALGFAVFGGLLTAACYLALEPAFRRRWPWRITAWSRLLVGRVRDPLVGRDCLAGAVAAVGFVLIFQLAHLAAAVLGQPITPFSVTSDIHGGGYVLFPNPGFAIGLSVTRGINGTVNTFLVAFVLGLLLRKGWLVWPVVVLFLVGFWQPDSAIDWIQGVTAATLLALVLARFGLLAGCAMGIGVELWTRLPPTAEPGAWHFWHGIAGVAAILSLAGYGFYTATGGKRLFTEGFFGDD